MFSPLRSNPRQVRLADSKDVPAPLGGWNARDGLAEMAPTDAVVLDNYFPGSESCDLRGGTDRFASIDGETDAPESLMIYSQGNVEQMLAAVGGAIYDVSLGGAISSDLKDGFTNNRWSYDHMGGYIVMVNGDDTPQKYDGSSVTDTTITGSGLTASDLNYVCNTKSRLFFVEKESLNAWYLGTNAIAGSASKLDFSNIANLGGKLIAIGHWTRDGGSGPDDLTVFLTSKGQALIYQGADPSSADTWSIVGVFDIGEPIGNRPFVNDGAELIVITQDGYTPLSKVLPAARNGGQALAISDKIRKAVSSATRRHFGKFGWEGISYARGPFMLFNVPTMEGQKAEQHVMNSITGKWCRFVNIKAVCWTIFNSKLYFGAPGGFVVEADTDDFQDDTLQSVQDFGTILGDIVPAYNYFGSKSQQKQFGMACPVVGADDDVTLSCVMNTDFSRGTPIPIETLGVSGTPWGSPWGSPWSPAKTIREQWIGTEGIGYCGNLHIRSQTRNVDISLYSIKYLYKPCESPL